MIKLILSIFVIVLAPVIFSADSSAASNDMMIVRLQASGMTTNTTAYEAVEIKNTSSQAVDVTDWCLTNTTKEIACIAAQDSSTRLDLLPGGSALFMTSVLEESTKTILGIPGYKSDFLLLADGISTSSGTIQLLDADKKVIDEVRWGGDSTTAPKLENAKMLQRNSDTDTDVSTVDFQKITTDPSLYQRSGLVERVVQIDTCPNLPDTQSRVPVGYMLDDDGNCYEDVCDNIAGLQKTIPSGYIRSEFDCEASPLYITEILPNVAGLDTGHEFIEVYNPNSFSIDLSGYYLQIDTGSIKKYTFPAVTLAAGEYGALSDIQLGITLPNTNGSLKLFTPLGSLVDESAAYSNPADDESWALIDGEWQYTNHPTPGSENVKSLIDTTPIDEPSEVVALVCPVGKYRNPETNRCKTVEADDTKPCAADQIRNPETNRCRSLLTSGSVGLAACKAGQERNPDTNRCRSIVSTASIALKPCPVNQERNPETNRCRKVISGTATQFSSIKDHDAPQKPSQYSWWLAGASIVGFGGYALWEWRAEAITFIRRMFGGFGKTPSTD